MMPPAQLTLILELTNERLVSSEKQEMTRQELLRWIGVCVLIAGINFRGRRRNLWEGGGTASKYLPSYDLRVLPPLSRSLPLPQRGSSAAAARGRRRQREGSNGSAAAAVAAAQLRRAAGWQGGIGGGSMAMAAAAR
jgi:hypothetical protein